MKLLFFIITLITLSSCVSKKGDDEIITKVPPSDIPDTIIYMPPTTNTDIVVTQSIRQIVDAADYSPSSRNYNIGQVSISEDLIPFLDSFISESAFFNRILPVKGLTMTLDKNLPTERNNQNILGYCYFSGGKPIVKLNPYKWEAMDESRKEALVFHELGHCLLNISNHDDSYSGSVPNSLMASNMSNVFTYYPSDRQDYLVDLFSH